MYFFKICIYNNGKKYFFLSLRLIIIIIIIIILKHDMHEPRLSCRCSLGGTIMPRKAVLAALETKTSSCAELVPHSQVLRCMTGDREVPLRILIGALFLHFAMFSLCLHRNYFYGISSRCRLIFLFVIHSFLPQLYQAACNAIKRLCDSNIVVRFEHCTCSRIHTGCCFLKMNLKNGHIELGCLSDTDTDIWIKQM